MREKGLQRSHISSDNRPIIESQKTSRLNAVVQTIYKCQKRFEGLFEGQHLIIYTVV
jgi:hypothetical protein